MIQATMFVWENGCTIKKSIILQETELNFLAKKVKEFVENNFYIRFNGCLRAYDMKNISPKGWKDGGSSFITGTIKNDDLTIPEVSYKYYTHIWLSETGKIYKFVK